MYSSDHGFGAVVPYAAPLGLQVIPGCFLNNSSNDDEEVSALISTLNTNQNATNIPFALVGSEAVSEQGVTPSELIARINQVRIATGNQVPIATAEFPQTWIQNPNLANAADVILVNIYPYYNGIAIDQAVNYLITQFNLVKSAYPNKPIMIGETGWPSAGATIGAAAASVQNEETYVTQVLSQTYSNGIGVLIFEAFDEAWKNSVGQGNFGIFTSQRNAVDGVPAGTPKGTTANTFIGPELAAAVLPESRSIQVGATVTAFATIINVGPGDASACALAPQTRVPSSFVYQTTNPVNNALTGAPNTPVNIAQGASQSFVFAFTPMATVAPADVAIDFFCANASPARISSGVNTLELSASATAVPDIVALAASDDPGYIDIPGSTGTGDFAVATINLGTGATMTATANTGSATLPVTLTLCQTNPSTGACMAAPTPSVTTFIPANATPTFGVFATGSGVIANAPGANRAFVTFTDSRNTLRGKTSVAVRTQ
jgi:exo-beta-1,3-glucanase (GH17 family)